MLADLEHPFKVSMVTIEQSQNFTGIYVVFSHLVLHDIILLPSPVHEHAVFKDMRNNNAFDSEVCHECTSLGIEIVTVAKHFGNLYRENVV